VLYLKNRNNLKELGLRQKVHQPAGVGQIIRRIFSLAIPVTVGGLVIPLITMIDLAIVPRQLIAAGFELERARALYGQLTGMAGSVVYFPNVVALALSMSLVPAISEAYALQNKVQIQGRTAMAIKLTVLFSLPAAAGLYLLAEPITVLLFNNAEAGYSLAYMSWSVVPLCLYVATTGLIQGLGKPIVPALNMFYGGLVKTALAWYLTAIPALNVGGAALASVAGLLVAAALNLLYVKRKTGWIVNLRELLFLPLFSTLLMAVVVYFCFSGIMRLGSGFSSQGLLNALAVFISILVGFFIYGLALLFSGGLNRAELVMVPYIGKSLAGLAGRFGFLK